MYRSNTNTRPINEFRSTLPDKEIVDEQPLSPSRRRTPLLPVVPLVVNEQPLSPTRRRSTSLSTPVDEEAYESPIPSVKRASKSTSTEVFTPQADNGSRIVTIRRSQSPPPVQRTSQASKVMSQQDNKSLSSRLTNKSRLANVAVASQLANNIQSRRTSQSSKSNVMSPQRSRRSTELSTPTSSQKDSVSFEMTVTDPNYQAIVELLRQCTTSDKCRMIKDHLAVGYDTDLTLDEAAASLNELSIFNLLTERTGLNNVLSQEKLTVFAPNNAAFEQLASTLGPARTDEQVATTLLSKLGTENVRNTLLNHVVPDIWNSDYLSKIANVDLITTSNQPLAIMPDNEGITVALGDQSAAVVEADIPASNGVIHVIDKVI